MYLQLTLLEENDYREHKKYIDGVFKSKEEIIKHCHDQGKDDIYFVLSFGAGTQSTHLLEEHLKGNIHYDYVVFSDTGAEPQFIHQQVAWWKNRQKEYGNTTPFITTTHNSMEYGLEEMMFRYLETDYQRFQLPLYFNKVDENGNEVQAGMTPRQCTVDFKIIPVKQAVRQLILKEYGLGSRQRFPGNVAIIQDIGFSFDELRRVSTWQSPQYKYIYMAYPLVEKGLSTQDSIDYLSDNGFPLKRSRCYFCPFNCGSDRDIGMDWEEIIEEEPLSFLKAVYFDNKLRKTVRTGRKNLRNIPYFHFSRRPLIEIYKRETQKIVSDHYVDFKIWENEWTSFIREKYKDAA